MFPTPPWTRRSRRWASPAKKTTVAEERQRPDVRERRERRHRETVADIPPGKPVFLDESGANTRMQRLYGRAPCGQRAYGVVPHGHYLSVTMATTLRLSGPFAAHAFVGAMNTVRFRAWVEGHLAPALRFGDVAVLDNLPAHKGIEAQRRIERAGARVLFLPPYSPDFNPDEDIWSKTKSVLRRMAQRTVSA